MTTWNYPYYQIIQLGRDMEINGRYGLCVFPLATSVIPSHIRIDTQTLINLLYGPATGHRPRHWTGNAVPSRLQIWNEIFRTDRRLFHTHARHQHTFDCQVETDG